MSNEIETRALRDALGQFATGVCVITTTDAADAPVGMTVNSFSSISLDPPLVGWCVGRDSSCFEAFVGARPFNIHILAADQGALSQDFALRGADPFGTVAWTRDARGVPVLTACPARFYCTPREHVDAGDHVLIIAAVNEFEVAEQEPLVFYRGRYR